MDSQTCPVEILEQIFNNLLKLDDLLNSALVCRRWNVAAERLILQRSQVPIFAGQSPCALADVTRNYRAVRIYFRDDRWDELRSLLDVCREKFHLCAVVIYGILADHLNRLYVAYREWLETVEEMVIFMDDRICQKLDGGPERFTLQLPNLKRLRWSEYLYQTANLSQLFTANECHLRELNVDQDTLSLREAFETHLVPFLDRSGHNVKKLILAKLTYFETDPYNCFTSCKPLHIETLCFHSTGCSLDFLEQLAGWSDLKELSIINCCIGTGGVHKTVTLANLKRLHIVNCTLSDESCTEFPIIGPNSETIRAQEEEDGALHFRNCWNH
ncbi:hypothetical protein quinque_011165 [Culex quinquefasciatus]